MDLRPANVEHHKERLLKLAVGISRTLSKPLGEGQARIVLNATSELEAHARDLGYRIREQIEQAAKRAEDEEHRNRSEDIGPAPDGTS
jgi:hypothetical protein